MTGREVWGAPCGGFALGRPGLVVVPALSRRRCLLCVLCRSRVFVVSLLSGCGSLREPVSPALVLPARCRCSVAGLRRACLAGRLRRLLCFSCRLRRLLVGGLRCRGSGVLGCPRRWGWFRRLRGSRSRLCCRLAVGLACCLCCGRAVWLLLLVGGGRWAAESGGLAVGAGSALSGLVLFSMRR